MFGRFACIKIDRIDVDIGYIVNYAILDRVTDKVVLDCGMDQMDELAELMSQAHAKGADPLDIMHRYLESLHYLDEMGHRPTSVNGIPLEYYIDGNNIPDKMIKSQKGKNS